MSDAQPRVLHKLRELFGRRIVVLMTALVAASLVITGFVWANKKVNIVVDGNTVNLSTIYTQPNDVLAQAKIYLGPNDEYRVSTPKIMDGTTIKVYRAVPVTVVRKDKTEKIITGKPTVGEVAASLGYTPATGKTVPPAATEVSSGMEVRIVTLSERQEVRKVPMPAPVIRQPDPNMEIGDEVVDAEGEDGLAEATVTVLLEDGVEVGTNTLSTKTLVQPKPQMIRTGTRDTVQTSRGTMRFKRSLWMEATAYLPTDGSSHGITASGIPARRGIVAVDPAVIPLGARVFIPGYGLALAADTGGAIVGDRIDLCVEDAGEAWRYGRQDVKVYVISE